MLFQINSQFDPAGDQPGAIEKLSSFLQEGGKYQILKGVTGSGKTYVMAKVIENLQRPTLIITHNKTLVGQLYQEFKSFFPQNAVEYFVSYYDYYQPEAYVPSKDIYIEKDSSINEEIDYLRHRATAALFERRDIIIVASVSCIYGLGTPENYLSLKVSVKVGDFIQRDQLLLEFVRIQYSRGEYLSRGMFRVRGDILEVFPKSSESAIRIEFFGDEVDRISEYDPLTGVVFRNLEQINIYPAQHYVTPKSQVEGALEKIRAEMKAKEDEFLSEAKMIEAQRIRERTLLDLEMIMEMGYCSGIENYSRHLEGREKGSPPATLLDYLPHDALIFLDESHVTIPQLKGMYNGDQARKKNLVDYGFRLPSALDNRPLRYEEFCAIQRSTIYVSATPGPIELENARHRMVPLIVRPTGLLDPKIEIRPVMHQVDDIIQEARLCIEKNERVFVTTLTKKMAEDLSEYMEDAGIACRYLHSDIETIERLELIRQLRLGEFHVLIGINLLREGLDVPEVSLVCILDADKQGFLRSATSLIQISGRAARNLNGRVIYYADHLTDAMKVAIREAEDRREVQRAYNEKYGIMPCSVTKLVASSLHDEIPVGKEIINHASLPLPRNMSEKQKQEKIKELSKWMHKASENLDFESAAKFRDQIFELQGNLYKGKKF